MKIYLGQTPQNLKLKFFLPKFSETSTPQNGVQSNLEPYINGISCVVNLGVVWFYTIQEILTNSLFIARQNSSITSIDTEFKPSSWKEFADYFLLIDWEEMIWIFCFVKLYLMYLVKAYHTLCLCLSLSLVMDILVVRDMQFLRVRHILCNRHATINARYTVFCRSLVDFVHRANRNHTLSLIMTVNTLFSS